MITYPLGKLKSNKNNTSWPWMLRLVVLLAVIVSIGVIAFTGVNAALPLLAEVRLQGAVDVLNQDRLTTQRQRAQVEIESAGERAVPDLLVALRSGNPVLRRNAADMLGYIASPQAASALRYGLINDPTAAVRINAAWALGEINDLSSLNDLQRAAVLDGNQSVRRTAADSIARIRSRLAIAAGINERDLSAFATASGDSNQVYLATRRDLVLSHDGGNTWKTNANVLPSLVTTLAVSAIDANVLYASADAMGLFKSTDGGVTWTAINTGLDVTPGARFTVTAIAIDGTDAQHMFITTGVWIGTSHVDFYPIAVMRTLDGGETWQVYQKSTNIFPVTQLALKGARLYALAGDQVLIY